jgi:hypothetical protein
MMPEQAMDEAVAAGLVHRSIADTALRAAREEGRSLSEIFGIVAPRSMADLDRAKADPILAFLRERGL